MDSLPLLFCQSVQVPLIHRIQNRRWSTILNDDGIFNHKLNLCKTKVENEEKWFYLLVGKDGKFVNGTAFVKPGNFRLDQLNVFYTSEDIHKDKFRKFQEISLEDLERVVVPFIRSNLTSRPSAITLHSKINIDFEDRAVMHLDLGLKCPETLEFLKFQLNFDYVVALTLRGQWPEEVSALLPAFFKKPSCYKVNSSFVLLPKEMFVILIEKFLSGCYEQLYLHGPTNMTFKEITSFLFCGSTKIEC
ncbi:hypothetical protein L596_005740 [Steinernema carpocapsae]|uniref:Uncharacterized protein n=1 Tax=Steinernema carpocapsae TaxID=34508 RepID=A0A4U8V038_STECR|nr:hypothetical protein L596_005740 [Steinernema carpocapsae]